MYSGSAAILAIAASWSRHEPETDPNAQAISTWEEPVANASRREDALIVDVAGYEGPLDLLLALARTQKVDMAKISVLALAEQYLAFIAEAQKLRLELAADYLVMAAWLAFLKSRCCCRARRARRRARAPRSWRAGCRSG